MRVARRRSVRSCTWPASWPQAASMSSPRVLRMVATMPASCSASGSATMRARGLVRNSLPGNGLNGIRLSLHGTSRTSATSSRACVDAVVDAVEHHVLERDEIARRTLEVAQARGHAARQRMLAVDRHDAVAQRVVRRVQRNRERDRALVAQAVDRGHDARRRQRDAAPRKAVRVVVEHQAQRGHDVVEVGERLAHAHHDDVGDRWRCLARSTVR